MRPETFGDEIDLKGVLLGVDEELSNLEGRIDRFTDFNDFLKALDKRLKPLYGELDVWMLEKTREPDEEEIAPMTPQEISFYGKKKEPYFVLDKIDTGDRDTSGLLKAIGLPSEVYEVMNTRFASCLAHALYTEEEAFDEVTGEKTTLKDTMSKTVELIRTAYQRITRKIRL